MFTENLKTYLTEVGWRKKDLAEKSGLCPESISRWNQIDRFCPSRDSLIKIRDAFNAAARQLEDHVRRIRSDVKTHAAPAHGKITRLVEDYGFITMPDGQEVYFHKNSVVDGDFYKLEVGNEVRLVIAEGEGVKGAQASTVSPIGKHHIVE